MFELSSLLDFIGTLFLVAAFFTLLYAILTSVVSDETLYDRTLLPSSDERKLTYYVEPAVQDSPQLFPTVFEEEEVYASFVVPAYNEEERLPIMLNDTLRYLESRQVQSPSFTWEIIVVDDGSRDHTADVVLRYASEHPEIRLLRQPVNMGKGAAIQAGCLHSRGQLILMVDADGATDIDEFTNLEQILLDKQKLNRKVIVVGSRSHLDGQSKAQRTPIRKFLGLAFHTLIIMSGVKGINDTQCGFKLFSREAARVLFPNQHIQRWCFDPELLVIGQKDGMEISEVPVTWNEIEGSKMKLIGMVRMATDLLQIALYHRVGLWTVKNRIGRTEIA